MERVKRMLRNIGLNDVESSLYLALLEHGTLGITELSKKASVHRTEAYRVLPHLLEMRLVFRATQGKRFEYSAESPDRLEELFQSFADDFSRMIPELRAMHQKSDDHPKFSFFSGRSAIRQTNGDVISRLPRGGCYYRLSSGRHSPQHYAFFPSNYSAERDKKDLERVIITSESNRLNDPKSASRSVVAIPEGFDVFDDHISKVIYGDRVTVFDYESETGFTIESARYARYEEKIFRLLYRLLK